MSKNQKSMFDIMKQVRNSWNINPRTRVQENKLKDKKKIRQKAKDIMKDDW